MTLVSDHTVDYLDRYGTIDHCRVRLFRVDGQRPVVIIQSTAPGRRISLVPMARYVSMCYDLTRDESIWIEYLPACPMPPPDQDVLLPAVYFRVGFFRDFLGKVRAHRWTMPVEQVEDLVGRRREVVEAG